MDASQWISVGDTALKRKVKRSPSPSEMETIGKQTWREKLENTQIPQLISGKPTTQCMANCSMFGGATAPSTPIQIMYSTSAMMATNTARCLKVWMAPGETAGGSRGMGPMMWMQITAHFWQEEVRQNLQYWASPGLNCEIPNPETAIKKSAGFQGI
jgi:hypothetical protein